jgi:hypothetical protein
MRRVLAATLVVLALQPVGVGQTPSPAVVLVTLDGARVEEMFGGLDRAVLQSTLRASQRIEDQPVYRRFWADTPTARRQKLMPFFWGTLMQQHGSIAGNPALSSRAHLTNRHWFSYPGYAELLLGRAHDDTIASNDPVRNPYPTVLEFIRARGGLTQAQAAVFASWSVFDAIVEHTPGTLTINAGFQPYAEAGPATTALNTLQTETSTPWDSVRHDAYTFRFAMDHLARHRPRVLYLALGETDDWAHDGRYDRVLEAFARTDGYLRELWTWLESQPDYRGRTHLLVTTDHGRGRTTKDWRDHGKDVDGAGEVWMAFASPSMRRRGEWREHQPLTASQAAATMVAWMGLDWQAFDAGAGRPVLER